MPYNMAIGPGDLPAGPLTKGLQVIFMQAYQAALDIGLRNRIATIVPSTNDSEDYSWLGDVPGVREFLGARQARDLANFNYNIRNKEWENINIRIRELAAEAARYQDQLCCEFLTGALGSAAAPYLCYDGQGLIDTDHTATSEAGGAVQSNRAGTALASASLWVAISAMRSYKSDTGRVLNASPDMLLVEPCLEQTAKELLVPMQPGLAANAATAVLSNMGIEVLCGSSACAGRHSRQRQLVLA